MKKRKTYEISVIDKTYSKTISDETKFYTSDTALELGFILKETEYDFESAEIVLLNIDDRSLVTRTVAKVLDSFTYELDDDIIAHYGEWRGQVRFEQAGEIYVSSPIKFRIENDLSNERPPQLSDVQSWVSLKRYADGLVDELKQAVLSVEGIEDTFNANELERQATFEKAETEREKGESIRVETFQTNETNRQSQFETAEKSRQTTFEASENERAETFNTNETTRQTQELERETAETTRQEAETQRISVESSRVSAEAQRKIDHENRSAELDGKANKKQEDWITPTLLNGWYAIRPYEPPQYMKDEFGFVHFRGAISKGASATSNVAFNLPTGYRPNTQASFSIPEVAVSPKGLAVSILLNGDIDFAGARLNSWYAISSITFKAV